MAVSNFFYTTKAEIRKRAIREENKKIPIVKEVDMPKNAILVLYLFKFVKYATKDQILRFANLAPNSRTPNWLYMHAYLDRGRLSQQSPPIYWIDKKGIKLLERKGVRGIQASIFTPRNIEHSLGVTESLITELASGCTALTTEFDLGLLRPDIYLERGKDVYFVEFDNGTENFTQLKRKFQAYADSDYVRTARSHLHIYYSDPGSKDSIKRAVEVSNVREVLVAPIRLRFIDMNKIIKSKSAAKKLAFAVS